jgi:hypothetical protein
MRSIRRKPKKSNKKKYAGLGIAATVVAVVTSGLAKKSRGPQR